MSKFLKAVVFAMCLVLLTGLVTGCGNSANTGETTAAGTSAAAGTNAVTAPASASENAQTGGVALPIVKDKLTLTCFYRMDGHQLTHFKDMNENITYQELEKRTNIHINYIHPAAGQDLQQLNLLIASKQMPDIIQYNLFKFYPGGPSKAIEDGVIIKLNDLIDKYAPNYSKILQDPAEKRQAALDDGTLCHFPCISRLDLTFGPIIRQDWLDKLGLQAPRTIDELHDVLKAFKESDPNGNGKKDEIPMVAWSDSSSSDLVNLFAPYGVLSDFYKDGNTVKFGPIEPAYRDALVTMNKWYREGLLDPEFALTDDKSADQKFTSDKAGFTYSYVGLSVAKYNPIMKAKNPGYNLVAIPNFIGPAGKQYTAYNTALEDISGTGKYISTNNKYQEETARWLDYHYGEEGIRLLNWGIEGETFTMANGEPEYTELITKNPEGLAMDEAAIKYTLAESWESFVRDPLPGNKYFNNMPGISEAIATLKTSDASLVMPSTISPKTEEAQQLASIINEVNTYKSEMFTKFVMGTEPLDNFDNYVDTIKKMNIDAAIAIKQAALDRYNKR